jgi:ABC-2 type transport system permease protein
VTITHDTPVAPPAARPDRSDRANGATRPGPFRRLRDVWEYRELLGNLVRKELKVKYKNSALGFVWSLLNPMLYLVVFYLVFTVFLKASIQSFPIFLLAGLLPYNLYSAGLGGGTTSIVGNAGLVSKVWFPREILPLAAIGAALVHFGLQLLVLAAALVVFWYEPSWSYLPLVIPALLVLLLLVGAIAIALAAINVYARDTQHLLELVLLAWFWMTPIVYPFAQVSTTTVHGFTIGNWAQLTNVSAVPDLSQWWYLRNLALVAIVAFGLLLFAFWIFGKLEDNFAETI